MKRYILILALCSATSLLPMEEPNPKRHKGLKEAINDKLNKEFLEAAKKGDLTTMVKLLQAGADIDSQTKSRATALHYAVAAGNEELVQWLLKNKAQVTIQGKVGARSSSEILTKLNGTPLHYAALLGHKNIVDLLVNYKASINSSSANIGNIIHHGVTPLYLAVEAKDSSMVEHLLNHGAKVLSKSLNTLDRSLELGNTTIIKLLADAFSYTKPTSKNWDALLSKAIRENNLEATKLILDYDPYICGENTVFNLGKHKEVSFEWDPDTYQIVRENRSLMRAISNGWIEIAKGLLERGASLCTIGLPASELLENERSSHHGTTCTTLDEQIQKFLDQNSEAIQNAFLSKAFGDEPLTLAVLLNDLAKVKELSTTATAEAKEKALIHAAAQLRKEIVLYLLSNGINPKKALDLMLSCENQQTIYHEIKPRWESIKEQLTRRLTLRWNIAYNPKCVEAITYLRTDENIPEDIDLKINPTGVLLDAISEGDSDLVSLALKAGANSNAKTQHGTPALSLAAFYKNSKKAEEMVTALIKYRANNVTELLLNFLNAYEDAPQRQAIIRMITSAIKQNATQPQSSPTPSADLNID